MCVIAGRPQIETHKSAVRAPQIKESGKKARRK